ncbi:RHS repeat protein [Pantoea ananatis]|uniref:RHS repeat domain-containing protein n=1 Tax=Pantoea ananas TaxID=553 RepID=UPI0024AD05ED|nr:RHS repeat domain-containing protein [Pantoea ananatis]MDI6539540.1 RHS repeat protein [Pantoea ananatis]
MTHHNTPTVTVLDNRGLTVRDIAYHRHPDTPDVTRERITRHQYDARGVLMQSADPRLHDAGLANFTDLMDLAGNVLRSQGVDNGTMVALSDAAGRPFISVSNISTAGDGAEDRSQAVTRRWQYEDATLPGRPLSITEQTNGKGARITERFVWAGNSAEEKALNLAGACVSHYDTAGLTQTDSVALTGVPLSVTRRLLRNADNPDAVADWQGEDTSAWNDLLDGEAYTTLTTTNATGAVLTTRDAKGNLQRVAYDVAGLLSGSWLTLKGGTEQVIVVSLTYSAAGQKLREEHGNGVVTTYTYEPETQRLTGIKTERPVGHASGAKVLQDQRYEYDPVGNVLKISNDAEETRFWRNQKVVPENAYAYDSLYQLVSATGREMANAGQQGSKLPPATIPLPTDSSAYTNYTRTYSYDNAGNLTQIRHSAPATGNSYTTDITVSGKSNRGVLSTLTENPADVDALFTAGGQQRQLLPGQNLVWTPRGELLKVTPVVRDGGTDDRESYRYGSNSQRILKVSVQKTGNGTQTQRALYLPGLELRTTQNGNAETESLQVITAGESGRAQVRVLHWESGRPAEITGDQVRYSYDNLTGSSQLELDGDGNVISTEEYYPYGGTAVWTARNRVEAAYKTIRYSGKERDATGLYYYGYRYYQPWAGRWMSADPAGTVDGLNLFRMVRNNPVTLRDTNGLLSTGEGAYERVSREFVAPAHMPAFQKVSRQYGVILSVRETGVNSIAQLKNKSAAKGHNILEKTIKQRSVESVYGEQTEETMAAATGAGLIGLVGHWGGENRQISGIWVHNVANNEDEIFPLTLSDKQGLADFKKQVDNNKIVPYTGDYDLHEIVMKDTRRKPGADSDLESHILRSLNMEIFKLDKNRPVERTYMNAVRHGPQSNFVEHMWDHERANVEQHGGYLAAVARPGPFPVALVDGDSWTVFDNEQEWRAYFRDRLISQPRHWVSFPEWDNLDTGLRNTSANYVATPAHKRFLEARARQ